MLTEAETALINKSQQDFELMSTEELLQAYDLLHAIFYRRLQDEDVITVGQTVAATMRCKAEIRRRLTREVAVSKALENLYSVVAEREQGNNDLDEELDASEIALYGGKLA